MADIKKTDAQTLTQGQQLLQGQSLVQQLKPGEKSSLQTQTGLPAYSSADVVKLSQSATAQSILSAAQNAMGGFQGALVDTLNGYNSGLGSLCDLTGTSVESFIAKDFTNLSPDVKNSFMGLFQQLSATEGGLAPQSLIDQTFGQGGDFGQLITTIGQKLSQAGAKPAQSGATGGTGSGTGGTSTIA